MQFFTPGPEIDRWNLNSSNFIQIQIIEFEPEWLGYQDDLIRSHILFQGTIAGVVNPHKVFFDLQAIASLSRYWR